LKDNITKSKKDIFDDGIDGISSITQSDFFTKPFINLNKGKIKVPISHNKNH